jgi:hypothetical protein
MTSDNGTAGRHALLVGGDTQARTLVGSLVVFLLTLVVVGTIVSLSSSSFFSTSSSILLQDSFFYRTFGTRMSSCNHVRSNTFCITATVRGTGSCNFDESRDESLLESSSFFSFMPHALLIICTSSGCSQRLALRRHGRSKGGPSPSNASRLLASALLSLLFLLPS